AVLRIQPVSVSSGEHPTTNPLQSRIGLDHLHQPLRQSAAAVRFEHKHVREISKRSTVGDHPRKPDLLPRAVDSKRHRALDRPDDDLDGHTARPVRFSQKTVNGSHVEQSRISAYSVLALIELAHRSSQTPQRRINLAFSLSYVVFQSVSAGSDFKLCLLIFP